jgi:hypothetical protein
VPFYQSLETSLELALVSNVDSAAGDDVGGSGFEIGVVGAGADCPFFSNQVLTVVDK